MTDVDRQRRHRQRRRRGCRCVLVEISDDVIYAMIETGPLRVEQEPAGNHGGGAEILCSIRAEVRSASPDFRFWG